MQIDIISDTVCPWCFIGKRRLSRALAERPRIEFDLKWRPYQLDASVPRGGLDRQAYMRTRFGGDQQRIVEIHKLLIQEGEKEGIAFDFAAIQRQPNTLDSHRLIRWAATAGVQDDVVERLFIAFFENGEDIGDIRVLSDIADLCGMDGLETAQMLESDADTALVEQEDKLAREMGVTGVPAFIFGSKLALSGARETPIFLTAIDKALEMAGVRAPADAEDDENETGEDETGEDA